MRRCARCGYLLALAVARGVNHYYALTEEGQIAPAHLCCSTTSHVVVIDPLSMELAKRQLIQAMQ